MSPTFGFSTTGDEVVAAFSAQVQGRVFVITGPSPKGIGEATVLSLARGHPASIILVGRTPAKYKSVEEGIRAIDGNIAVKTYGLDLGSLASVRAGAGEILKQNPRIDVLINNAGVTHQTRELTPDGVEINFATNHIGHFLLTKLLLPALRKSDAPRVINLSSGAYSVAKGDYDDYNWERKPYEFYQAYAESKLANIHFTQYLAAHGNGLVALSVHPGTIWGTALMRDFPEEQKNKTKNYVISLKVKDKTLEQGAATTLVAALDPAFKDHKGAYMADCQVAPLQGVAAEKSDLAEKLWRISERIIGESFTL